MSTPNYAEMFPHLECDPCDAIEALVEKVPGYLREGLFDISDFVQIFASRINSIMAKLPREDDKIRKLEKMFIYMLRDLGINRYLKIKRDDHLTQRSVEFLLESEGVFAGYLKFSQEEGDSIDITKPELFADFLDYLASYISVGIKESMIYLQTCINISQIDGGVDILMMHLERSFSIISTDKIDDLIERNRGYLLGGYRTLDKEIHRIMESEGLDYYDASFNFGEFQKKCAGLHFLLLGIYNEYIIPKLAEISVQEKYIICTMLDNLLDIVDPNYYVPLAFQHRNISALLEITSMSQGRKQLH